MNRYKYLLITLFFATFFCSEHLAAFPHSTGCLRVKIFSKSKIIAFKEKDKFVVHFQLENCGLYDLPIDFYGNLGYPEDSACNIYFQIMRADNDGRYLLYTFVKADYKNVIDSTIQLKPHKIYSFYLPLFEIYGIKEPGNYRLQGIYRFKKETGEYLIQKSDYLDIQVK